MVLLASCICCSKLVDHLRGDVSVLRRKDTQHVGLDGRDLLSFLHRHAVVHHTARRLVVGQNSGLQRPAPTEAPADGGNLRLITRVGDGTVDDGLRPLGRRPTA